MLKIEYIETEVPVYDITVENNHNFFANDILIHNCQEIFLPTQPYNLVYQGNGIYKEEGEIALCILANVNPTKDNLEENCELSVRFLNELIDHQFYPSKASEDSTKKRGSLGIGILSLAHYYALNNLEYGTPKALEETHKLMEKIQFNLIKASVRVAKEFGVRELFHESKYSDGLLPIDWYNKNVDELVEPNYEQNWEWLRMELKKFGARNSALSAIPPSENSAIYSNSTNNFEPITGLEIILSGMNGKFKMIVPDINILKNKYEQLWYIYKLNEKLIKTVAVLQKWTCQGISLSLYYNYTLYQNKMIPASEMINDRLLAYKYGLKSIYYVKYNTGEEDSTNSGCSSGGCSV